MPDAATDPFVLLPNLWYGLLCEGITQDNATKKVNLLGIFNKVQLLDPPEESGVVGHAAVNGILAVGFSGGLGHFEASIELRNADGRTLWQHSENWIFDLGPGEQGGAVLALQVRHWLTQRGQYQYCVRLEPSGQEYLIPFEVHRQVAPIDIQQDDSGGQPN